MLCMLSEDLMGFLVSGKWRKGEGREGGREGGGRERGSYTWLERWRAFVQCQFV